MNVVDGVATITITLTEPGCPFTHHIVAGITEAAAAVSGVKAVEVAPRWAPLWIEDRLSATGRQNLDSARTQQQPSRSDLLR